MKKSNVLIWIFTISLSFIALHISAVFYIASNIEEENKNTAVRYPVMSEKSLPIVSITQPDEPGIFN